MIHYISGEFVDNDGGSLKANGSTNNTKFTKTPTPRKDLGVFGSTVIDSDNTDPALVLGLFAYNNSRPVGKKVASKINIVDNNFLMSGALVPRLIQSIRKMKVCVEGCSDGTRTRQATKAMRNDRYNIYNNKFDAGFPLVVVDFFQEDKEASVNRTNTGGFIYKMGSLPISKNYPVKTG
jgi:hypothetical protein